jgi:hypothetical protein
MGICGIPLISLEYSDYKNVWIAASIDPGNPPFSS